MSLSTNTTYRVLLEKLGGSNPNTFIGDEGELFYNPSGTTLKISDGSTPGGVSVAGGGGGSAESYWIKTTAGIHTLSNVGVGTTNPQYKLDVGGEINSSDSISATYSLYFLNGSGSLGSAYDEGMLQLMDKDLYINANDIIFTSYNNGGTNSGELMRLVTTSGNLGIGTTNPTSKLTVAGQFQSIGAGSTLTGGGQIYLNDNTSNRIDFNQNGVGYPSNTTRSAGTKIVLYPGAIDGYEVDSAIGIAGGVLWQSVPYDMYQFKWYAGTAEIASLGGGRFSLTGVDAYISGNTGIGTDNTTSKLEVQGGDIKVGVNTSQGLILTSPNGTKFRLIVNNSGALSTVLVP
jgi:hypothetical protein